MLWVISLRPGFTLSIFAGVVWRWISGVRIYDLEMMHLCVIEAFEEWSNANESDVVIPHHGVFLVVSWDLENVLKDCHLGQHTLLLTM
jgi:hypothetical protein